MSTLRLRLAGMVMMALLVGVGGAALAQMDEEADAVYVTTEQTTVESDPGTVSRGASLYSSRGGVNTLELDASDPRVSGTGTVFWNVDVDPDTGQGIMWGTYRIDNAAGAWEGPWSGMEYEPGEADYFTVSGWLSGDGSYAGYTYYFQLDAFQYGGPVRQDHGVIFKGQPPVPDPPAE